MARARATEAGLHGHGAGEAADAASPADPLELVQAAVAGRDLLSIIRRTAQGAGRTVAVVMPGLTAPLHWPEIGSRAATLAGLADLAAALAGGRPAVLPDGVSDAVGVQLGPRVVGVVAALGPGPADIPAGPWLAAAAAAAAVSALLHDAGAGTAAGDESRRRFLESLELQRPADLTALRSGGLGLGADLAHGAIGICALLEAPLGVDAGVFAPGALLAEIGPGRLVGLVPLDREGPEPLADELVSRLRDGGARAARSAPRLRLDTIHDALVEAGILAELQRDGEAETVGGAEEETLRLLVGVLLRSPEELERLRAGSVAELERYDGLHDTELVATLQAFLTHHGSTTETAEAMSLHRHTVGYRLARVQEVAGLSPYDSDGRERLSLGLKADRVLAAERRRVARVRAA